MISMTGRRNLTVNEKLDRLFAGRRFEVYSLVTDKSLSAPMPFNRAFNEMENIGYAAAASNGTDIREVK